MDSSRADVDSRSNAVNRHQSGAEESALSRALVHSLFPLLICTSLSLGWWVPTFYNWSGDNQSRSPPIVGYVMNGFILACVLSIFSLPLLPKLDRIEPGRNPLIRPFGLRTGQIIAAAGVAGVFTVRDATFAILGIVSFLYPLLCAIKLGMASPSQRWRIISLYSSLYLPFVWIFENDVFQGAVKQGSVSFLPLLAGAPALLCSLLVGKITGDHNVLTGMIAVAVVGLEVVVGLWINQLGARRAAAYQITLLAVSVVTSYGLLALLRA